MAEEEDQTTPQQTPDAEAPSDEPHASAPDADAAPAPESEPEGGKPAAEPAAAEPPDASAVGPKERRRRERAAKFNALPTRPATSPEERQAERDEARGRKATVRRARRQRDREKARGARGATPEPVAARDLIRPGTQKTRQGIVVSDRAAKTITVRIDLTRRHPRYQKIVRTSSTLHAHDENGDAHLGDTVVVRECRPLSRTKRWRLVEVVERAK